MNHRGFRGWKWLGGLATVALLGAGCGLLPVSGGRHADDPRSDFFGGLKRNVPDDYYSRTQADRYRGFNGTIAQLGSSIDPRTPEKEGTPGRSLQQEVSGWTPVGDGWEQGIGGYGGQGQ